MRRFFLPIFVCCTALFAAGPLAAQPTDAEVKKQVTGPRTVSVMLGGPGKVDWSSTYKKYLWTRNFTAKLKTEDPEIFLLVKGYAAYDVMTGKYVFWRTFTTSNSYDGIPDVTPTDVQALIKKFGVPAFMRDYWYNRAVGPIESIGMSPEPNIEWHTPNSVSFNIVARYTHRKNDVGARERGERTFRIRLYRDNTKAEWKNVDTTDKEWKVL